MLVVYWLLFIRVDTIQCGLNVVVSQGLVTYIYIYVLGLVIYCPQIYRIRIRVSLAKAIGQVTYIQLIFPRQLDK